MKIVQIKSSSESIIWYMSRNNVTTDLRLFLKRKSVCSQEKISSVTVIWDNLAFFHDMLSISRLFTPLCQFPLHLELDKSLGIHNHNCCHVRNSPLSRWWQIFKRPENFCNVQKPFNFIIYKIDAASDTLAPYNRLSICLLNSSLWGFYIVMLCENL